MGFLGGSDFNICGPAGALVSIVAQYSILFGPLIIPKITIAAGCITVLFFVCRIEQAMLFVNTSVMQGFSLSVACVIGFSQLEMFLGTQPQTSPNWFGKLTLQLMQIPQTSLSSFV